jgi:hypothetical protein
MILVLEIYENWIDGLDLNADNQSDKSKRELMKTFSPFEQEQQKRLHGYSVIKINNDDSTIKYGNFELGVFKPPINMRKRFQKDLIKQEQLKIVILLTLMKSLIIDGTKKMKMMMLGRGGSRRLERSHSLIAEESTLIR